MSRILFFLAPITVPRAMISPENQTKNDSDQVLFHCAASAHPLPIIHWQFRNKTVVSGGKYVIDNDHGTLLIKNLDHRETFGDVTCIASNAAGSSVAQGHLSVLREYLIFLGNCCHYNSCISCFRHKLDWFKVAVSRHCMSIRWVKLWKRLNLINNWPRLFKFGRDIFQTFPKF